jgi:hypothetical protein
MKNFYKSDRKELTEMAAPKMPEGTKRKRSATYQHTHDIHIGGEHVATISGHQANRRHDGRGLPAHVKIYSVHHNEAGMLSSEYHRDHSFEKVESYPTQGKDGHWDYGKMKDRTVRKPVEHHSMEDAVHAVISAHKNNQEFGANHDPKTRWAHAISKAQGHDDHEKRANKYHTALMHAKDLGHDDVTNALQAHHDAHMATGSKPSQDKLKQWTHDAHRYTHTTYHPTKYENNVKVKDAHDAPTYPEHYDMAKQAHNVHMHGHPGGSEWARNREKRGY